MKSVRLNLCILDFHPIPSVCDLRVASALNYHRRDLGSITAAAAQFLTRSQIFNNEDSITANQRFGRFDTDKTSPKKINQQLVLLRVILPILTQHFGYILVLCTYLQRFSLQRQTRAGAAGGIR